MRRWVTFVGAALVASCVVTGAWSADRSAAPGDRTVAAARDGRDEVDRLRRAAERGDPEAQNALGAACERGDGVARDLEEAVRWYGRAAKRGHAAARRNLERVLPRALAAALAELGYPVASRDGGADPDEVREALGTFRQDAGLPPDDRLTLDALALVREHRALRRGFEVALEGGSHVGVARMGRETARSIRGATAHAPSPSSLPATTAAPARFAVVIGVGQNRDPAIPRAPFAIHDAETVARFLVRALGYEPEEVRLLLDPRRAQLARWFEERGEPPEPRPEGIDEGDLFVYYSGPSTSAPGTGRPYLLPYDADPARLEESAYPLDRLGRGSSGGRARRVVVVLDTTWGRGLAPVDGDDRDPAFLALGPPPGPPARAVPNVGLDRFTYWWLEGAAGGADLDGDRAVTVGEWRVYLEERFAAAGDAGPPVVVGPEDAVVTALAGRAEAPPAPIRSEREEGP